MITVCPDWFCHHFLAIGMLSGSRQVSWKGEFSATIFLELSGSAGSNEVDLNSLISENTYSHTQVP